MRICEGSLGRVFIEFSMVNRRLHGLKPEFELEEAQDRIQLENEPEKVKIIREFKETYDATDLSGIDLPIHVDGTYHG